MRQFRDNESGSSWHGRSVRDLREEETYLPATDGYGVRISRRRKHSKREEKRRAAEEEKRKRKWKRKEEKERQDYLLLRSGNGGRGLRGFMPNKLEKEK